MDQQIAKHIEQLERELLSPEGRRSPGRIAELLADEFFEFGSSGERYTKKDIVEFLPQMEGVKYEGSEFEAREIAPDTVLLTYKALVTHEATGEAKRTLRSSLWQKRGENWQQIFHQGTVEKG